MIHLGFKYWFVYKRTTFQGSNIEYANCTYTISFKITKKYFK